MEFIDFADQLLGRGDSGAVLLGTRGGIPVAIKSLEPEHSTPRPLQPGAEGTVEHQHLVEVGRARRRVN